jgi:hypothetical protein
VRFVECSAVQEAPSLCPGTLIGEPTVATSAGTVNLRFTSLSILSENYGLTWFYNAVANFQDCEFRGSVIEAYNKTQNFTNCWFDRVLIDYEPSDANTPVLRNNHFLGGSFTLSSATSATIVKDNLFDRTTISTWGGIMGLDAGYNAYVTNCNRITPTNSHDVLITDTDYKKGDLSDHYYPTGGGKLSLLINAGSTTADLVQLYHFTVSTNLVSGKQIRETNSVVDIGRHLVALDSNGNLLNGDGDPYPDWWEDINGDGSASGDPTSWSVYNSPNGLASGSGLQVFTPIQ